MSSSTTSICKKATFLVVAICILLSPFSQVLANPHFPMPLYDVPPADWRPNQWASVSGPSGPTDQPWHGTRELPPRQLGLNIQGDVPVLRPPFFDQYQTINQAIDDAVDFLIADARRARARSINFTYEIHPTSDMVSILIRASVSSAIYRTLVRSVNFCIHTGRLIPIGEAMDIDVLPLARRILMDHLRHNPAEFYGVTSVSLDDQAFFVTDTGITILFDEFQLSSTVSGVFTLDIARSHVQTVTMPASASLPNDHAYNLIMVPLRLVASGLGYHLYWAEEEGIAEVYLLDHMGNRHVVAWLSPSVNAYYTQDTVRSLEAAPIRPNGQSIYVPITFFDHIMPLSAYTIDAFGNITFLAYLDPL